jgi:hypothetical protein
MFLFSGTCCPSVSLYTAFYTFSRPLLVLTKFLIGIHISPGATSSLAAPTSGPVAPTDEANGGGTTPHI